VLAIGCPRTGAEKEPETVLAVVAPDGDGLTVCGEKFEQVAEQTEGSVKRLVGFVRAKHMLQLFDAADLEANPREAKAGSVTADIIESIRETPDTFPFKTKGVLVGASNYEALQRNRYELRFENTKIEGILDGGHNMLAIGTYILSKALADDRMAKRIKTWTQMKEAWATSRNEINLLKKNEETENAVLNFLIPLEILVPSDLEDGEAVSEFGRSLFDITSVPTLIEQIQLVRRFLREVLKGSVLKQA
jgi:hypothetical protein